MESYDIQREYYIDFSYNPIRLVIKGPPKSSRMNPELLNKLRQMDLTIIVTADEQSYGQSYSSSTTTTDG
jgi:hypothetical protein